MCSERTTDYIASQGPLHRLLGFMSLQTHRSLESPREVELDDALSDGTVSRRVHTSKISGSDSLKGFAPSFRAMVLSSKLHLLLIFVPLGICAYVTSQGPMAIFVTNAIGIVPLSMLLTEATECMAQDVGDTLGALLNITLGNLVELILLYALSPLVFHNVYSLTIE